MNDVLWIFGILAVWFGMVRWVLPWLGIPTCMSGSCRIPQSIPIEDDSPRDKGNSYLR